ncbi:hypothetical protein LCGC14_0342480 [marine sediment metagenome]|uniref:Uncharacterized protein n=1 Tax=marine sediment metagenome TaxID=412755 RepID=A0A0F9W0P3_9ZZZZ
MQRLIKECIKQYKYEKEQQDCGIEENIYMKESNCLCGYLSWVQKKYKRLKQEHFDLISKYPGFDLCQRHGGSMYFDYKDWVKPDLSFTGHKPTLN